MNEYTVITRSGIHLQYFSKSEKAAREEATADGHNVKYVRFVRSYEEDDDE
jgi:hypothetical protein